MLPTNQATVTPARAAAGRAPFVTPEKVLEKRAECDCNVFHCEPNELETGVCSNTASANGSNARISVNAALDRSGTHRVFSAMDPAALPLLTAPITEWRQQRKWLNDMKDGLDLTNAMRNKLVQSAVRRMEFLNGESQRSVNSLHQRKSPTDKKVTDDAKTVVNDWVHHKSSSVDVSPDQKDCMHITWKHPVTGQKTKIRNFHHKCSLRELCNDQERG